MGVEYRALDMLGTYAATNSNTLQFPGCLSCFPTTYWEETPKTKQLIEKDMVLEQ